MKYCQLNNDSSIANSCTYIVAVVENLEWTTTNEPKQWIWKYESIIFENEDETENTINIYNTKLTNIFNVMGNI